MSAEKKLQQLWDINDLIAYMKVSRSTAMLYVSTNKIPSIKIGRKRRFIPGDVERAMKKLSS